MKKETKRIEDEENQKQLSIKNYEYIFNNSLSTLLIGLIIRKKTALCLSLDVSSWKIGREILELCGPYICMVKLHSDLFIDIGNINSFIKELKGLARKYKFLIMEDMKLGDVDKITYKKITNSFFKYGEWANLITIHGLTANSVYEYTQKQSDTDKSGFGEKLLLHNGYLRLGFIAPNMISKSLATSYLFFFIIIIETNRHILSLPPKNDRNT